MMDRSSFPLIAVIIPFLVAFIIGIIKDKYIKVKRLIIVVTTLVSLVFTLMIIPDVFIDGKVLTYFFGNWQVADHYIVGIMYQVDSLSLFIGIIIAVSCFLSSIYSMKYMSKDTGLGKYYTLFLLLTGSMLGFVYTGDIFNMYVMLEIMTFAAIALTAFRNDKYKSLEAGFKYLVIGGLGSSLILLGTVLVYFEAHTLNLANIFIVFQSDMTPIRIVAIALLITGYAVKSFMVPCHTWPPDAHMSAPSSISMLLSGVMSKTGVYAIIRLLFMVFGITGNKAMAYLIIIWGAITMVVGVSMALLQSDFKRLLAFHSVSQLGYVIAGVGIGLIGTDSISNLGLAGGLYHMLNHATFKCLLFLCAGAVLYRVGTTDLNNMSGLGKKMPFTTVMFIIAAAAISGIPPFNGFTSKWLIYQASFESGLSIIAVVALVVSSMTLASFIKVIHSAFFGPQLEENDKVKEVPLSMKIPMAILAAICILAGVFSKFVLEKIITPVVAAIRGNLLYSEVFDNVSMKNNGFYNPEVFLLLFFIIIIAVLITTMLCTKGISKAEESVDSSTKYEVFTGGEKDEDAKVGPHDLFWGLKYDFKGYFARLGKAHSGIVNDYVLWVVMTLAVITVYCFIVL